MFENKTLLSNNFHFKDRIHKDLTSGGHFKFQCGLCNESCYGKRVIHLNVRTGEHTAILPLTKNQVKPKNISIVDHILFCNHSASYDDFTILTRQNKMF